MIASVENRRSIRRYKSAAVPKNLIEEVLKAGALAPSSKNRQPWKFVVVSGEAKEKMLAAMQEGLKEAALVPMEVAETVASLFPTLETVVRKGNARAVTDGMVGTMLARTAVLGALFNVRVNLESIRDSDFTAALSARADAAQELALSWEKRILSPIALAGKL